MDEERLAEIEAYARSFTRDTSLERGRHIRCLTMSSSVIPELVAEVRRLRGILDVATGCPSPDDTSWTDRDIREFIEDLHVAVHG